MALRCLRFLILLAALAAAAPRASALTYTQAVIADDPVAWWRFGDGAGATTAADSTARTTKHDGTYKNTVAAATSAPFAAVAPGTGFDHVDDHVEVADHADLNTANVSIEAWFYLAQAGASGWHSIVGKGPSDGGDQYTLLVGSDGGLYFDWGGYMQAGAGTVSRDAWHHVVATVSTAGSGSVYIDGAVLTVGVELLYNQAGTRVFVTDPLWIGTARQQTGYYWNGFLDEVAIYDKLLDATDASEHYAARLAASDPVPEPASLALAAAGVLFAAARRRRRANRIDVRAPGAKVA